jgi:hypothetical protein
MNESSSCSPSSGCCAPTRRDFLRFIGLGGAAMFLTRVFTGPFEIAANAGLGHDPLQIICVSSLA